MIKSYIAAAFRHEDNHRPTLMRRRRTVPFLRCACISSRSNGTRGNSLYLALTLTIFYFVIFVSTLGSLLFRLPTPCRWNVDIALLLLLSCTQSFDPCVQYGCTGCAYAYTLVNLAHTDNVCRARIINTAACVLRRWQTHVISSLNFLHRSHQFCNSFFGCCGQNKCAHTTGNSFRFVSPAFSRNEKWSKRKIINENSTRQVGHVSVNPVMWSCVGAVKISGTSSK